MTRAQTDTGPLFLGIDGGGTSCRARLCAPSGVRLGEGLAGPANIRLGLTQSLNAVLDATRQCLQQAGLASEDLPRVSACLALAGASEPNDLAAARRTHHPFGNTVITTDAHAACLGAHRGKDGGIIVVGTGTIGWAEVAGRRHRVGGWGFQVSDEGSGAWLGREAIRRVLWAHDGRAPWTELLKTVWQRFDENPHVVVRWSATAQPRDFGSLAPLVVQHAEQRDPAAVELMTLAAGHIDALAARLVALGTERICLVGGLATTFKGRASDATRAHLVSPAGDALDGALMLARTAAQTISSDMQQAV